MNLSQRGGGDRFFLKGEKNFFDGRTKLEFGLEADGFKIHRRNFILQSRKFIRDLGRQDIQARRKELPHLDHHAAEANCQGAETNGNILQPPRTGILCPSAEPNAPQENIPENYARCYAGKEQNDAPITHSQNGFHEASMRGNCSPAFQIQE